MTTAGRKASSRASLVISAILALAVTPTLASEFPTRMQPVEANVAVCFTPGENCEGEIVAAIDGATSEIRVQAYGFSSLPILHALRNALRRGVSVSLVLDKTDARDKSGRMKIYGPAGLMALAGATVWVDDHAGIAHNKVIIIDGWETIGGSFNYTKSAAIRNRENVTFISSPEMADAFLANWEARRAVSSPFVLDGLHGPH